MAKKTFDLGNLSIVLVFGMVIVGCDNGTGGGEINYLDTLNLSTAAPSAAALSAGGLTQVQFNQIRDAGAGVFRGWAIRVNHHGLEHSPVIEHSLEMIWTGCNLANFNAVADVFGTILDVEIAREVYKGVHMADDSIHSFFLQFFPTRFVEDGFYIPAGSMLVVIWGARRGG